MLKNGKLTADGQERSKKEGQAVDTVFYQQYLITVIKRTMRKKKSYRRKVSEIVNAL